MHYFMYVLLVWIEEQAFIITGWYQITGNDVQVFFNSILPAKFQCKLDKDTPVLCKHIDEYAEVITGRVLFL